MPKIEKIYAYVATKTPDDEKICAILVSGSPILVPMIGTNDARMKSLKPYAEKVAKETNKRVVLAEFSVRKDLEVIPLESELNGRPEKK